MSTRSLRRRLKAEPIDHEFFLWILVLLATACLGSGGIAVLLVLPETIP
ncbi:MAG: hypothetical protein ACOZAM_06580 [Pseudomonadota bacterium]